MLKKKERKKHSYKLHCKQSAVKKEAHCLLATMYWQLLVCNTVGFAVKLCGVSGPYLYIVFMALPTPCSFHVTLQKNVVLRCTVWKTVNFSYSRKFELHNFWEEHLSLKSSQGQCRVVEIVQTHSKRSYTQSTSFLWTASVFTQWYDWKHLAW